MISMKVIKYFLMMMFIASIASVSYGQVEEDSVRKVDNKIYIVETSDGNIFMGTIISQDSKEVLILTKDRGEISIPKYQVKSIKELEEGQLNAKGEYIPSEVFSTRYFITTNGLPLEKGENYILWNLFGPEFHWGVAKNFGLGIMTSWGGVPIIGTAKYSIKLGEKSSFGIGLLAGTGSWILPRFGGVLPFGALTIGDRRANLNISGGYGYVNFDGDGGGTALMSVAGMVKVGKKISVVFDSFIVPGIGYKTVQQYVYNPNTGYGNYQSVRVKRSGGGLLIPGIRYQIQPDAAFQFGFAGLVVDQEVLPVPIPMIGWFRKI
jgi:hypothetical protein